MSGPYARPELCETVTRCLHCAYVSNCVSFQAWEYTESNEKSTAERLAHRRVGEIGRVEDFLAGSEALQLTLPAGPENVPDSED
jgi:hypothetical protein